MAIARATGNAFLNTGAPSFATTLQFANNITAGGSLLVCLLTWDNTTDTPTISDDINGAWTVLTKSTSGSFNRGVTIGYFYNSASGSRPTVTVAGITAGAFRRFAIVEYTGVESGSSPYDGTSTAQTSGSAHNPTSGNITTTANGMVVAIGMVYSTTGPAAASGYTVQWNETTQYEISLIDNLTATTGTNAASWTTSETYSLVIAAAFKGASGAAGLAKMSEFAFQAVNRASSY